MRPNSLMQHAYIVAQESNCVSWKVGAIIVKDGRIISTGYNGSPSKRKNCCDHAHESGWTTSQYDPIPPHTPKIVLKPECRDLHSAWSKEHEIHAEHNAIIFADKNGTSVEGATMYCTLSPCPDCSKIIIENGIKHVVYSEKYDKLPDDWEQLFISAGVTVSQIPKESLKFLNWASISTYGGI